MSQLVIGSGSSRMVAGPGCDRSQVDPQHFLLLRAFRGSVFMLDSLGLVDHNWLGEAQISQVSPWAFLKTRASLIAV